MSSLFDTLDAGAGSFHLVSELFSGLHQRLQVLRRGACHRRRGPLPVLCRSLGQTLLWALLGVRAEWKMSGIGTRAEGHSARTVAIARADLCVSRHWPTLQQGAAGRHRQLQR